MDESLKQKTFSGLVWNFLETFALQGFGFVQGIILARLLMPSDYGNKIYSMISKLVCNGAIPALISLPIIIP